MQKREEKKKTICITEIALFLAAAFIFLATISSFGESFASKKEKCILGEREKAKIELSAG